MSAPRVYRRAAEIAEIREEGLGFTPSGVAKRVVQLGGSRRKRGGPRRGSLPEFTFLACEVRRVTRCRQLEHGLLPGAAWWVFAVRVSGYTPLAGELYRSVYARFAKVLPFMALVMSSATQAQIIKRGLASRRPWNDMVEL